MEIRDFSYIDRNLAEIRARMEAAAKRSGKGNAPRLLVASKYATAEEMNYAASLGVEMFGENRVPSLLEKYDALDKKAELHFIGSLQTNKVKSIIGKVSLIHSLDSVRLAETIEKHSANAGTVTDVLCEINSGREPQKGGIMPEDFPAFAARISEFPHINLRGLMTMAPSCENVEEYRKYFRETYNIFIDFFQKKPHNIGSYVKMPILSMGMSESFEIAIEEGADIVRVGRAVFKK